MLVQSPAAVPCSQVCTWSIAAAAAGGAGGAARGLVEGEAADEAPRALMPAAPRCCTTGMNEVSIHCCVTRDFAALPPTSAWLRSGYCVAEWLPQIVMRRISLTWELVFSASCASARL